MFNVKSYVRNLLMDNSIVSLTGDNTVHFIHADNPSTPYIEYEFYDESGNAYEEGNEISTDYFLQVDIFSKGSYMDLENAIKQKLKSENFNRIASADLYEKDTHFFHKAMRFNFTIEKEDK